jgi:hypothetical protein
MFERFNIPTGLVFEYPTPNLSNIQLQTYIYWSLVGGYAGGYAGGSAPQRRVHRIHRIHRITSYNILRLFLPSVHIDGGGGRPFFYFTNHMFERFTVTSNPQLGLVFEYRGLCPQRRDSHYIRRPFLPSVNIDGGGRRQGSRRAVGGQSERLG